MPQQLIHLHSDRPGDHRPPGGRAPRRRVAAGVLLAAGLAGVLSASGSNSAVGAEPQLRPVPPIYRLVYLADEADRRIGTAKQLLITTCMAAHGLTYTPHVEGASGEEALSELRPFGLESLDGLTTDPPPPEPARGEEYSRALFGDPDQRVVASGARLAVSRPATGCVADAEHRLLGQARLRATELRLRLFDGERDVREQLDHDPVFIAATARWRACMNQAGIDSPSPTELLRALPTDKDITTHPAVRTDIHCKHRTGYLTAAYGRLAELQQAWTDAHRDVVTEWTTLRQRQDAVARQVIASAPDTTRSR